MRVTGAAAVCVAEFDVFRTRIFEGGRDRLDARTGLLIDRAGTLGATQAKAPPSERTTPAAGPVGAGRRAVRERNISAACYSQKRS
jgi:hypothetical protein